MKMKKHLVLLLVLALLITVVSSKSVSARASSATANIFLPATDASPYLTLYGSQTIQPWRYHFGAYFNYAKNPLEVGVAGNRRAGVIDHLIVGDFFATLGLTDWLHASVNVPVAFYEDFNDLTAGTSEKSIRMGDVRVETKFRLLDIDRHSVGIAILPYLLTPTGSGSRLVGNNRFAGGAKAIVDFKIKDRVQISTNLGYLARDGVTVLNTRQDDQFTYGLGVNIRTTEWLDIIAETYGNTNVSDFYARQTEIPLEVDGALRFNLPNPEGLALTVGGGAGLTFGYGAPDIRALVGLSYPNPKRVELPTPPPPPVEEPIAEVQKEGIVITKKIHFEFDRAVIRPISFRILDAVVDVMKQNPDIKKVEVAGHCDGKGTDAYNVKLSNRRANAVRDYIIAHGVEGDHLTAVGYGESKPVDTNDTAEGRAKNRRVEFIILEQEGVAP